jgi:hypothetical protein
MAMAKQLVKMAHGFQLPIKPTHAILYFVRIAIDQSHWRESHNGGGEYWCAVGNAVTMVMHIAAFINDCIKCIIYCKP